MSDVDPRVRELFDVWRVLSETVHRIRHTPLPASTNPLLEQHVRRDPQGPLAPMLCLWMGDSLQMEGRHREAIAAYENVVASYGDRRFGDVAWAAVALEQIASCHEQLDDRRAAERALQQILTDHRQSVSPAWIQHRIGALAEQDGRDDDALAAYTRAKTLPRAPRQTQVNINDLARRDAARLRLSRDWMRPRPETLVRDLLRALRARDARALERLASPTHF
jgi:tetratricopeptide (TPR) repeat protein